MKRQTKIFTAFKRFMRETQNITLVESACSETGYKVCPRTKYVEFNEGFTEVLAESYEDAWVTALDKVDV